MQAKAIPYYMEPLPSLLTGFIVYFGGFGGPRVADIMD
jgi:hypothetical protein